MRMSSHLSTTFLLLPLPLVDVVSDFSWPVTSFFSSSSSLAASSGVAGASIFAPALALGSRLPSTVIVALIRAAFCLAAFSFFFAFALLWVSSDVSAVLTSSLKSASQSGVSGLPALALGCFLPWVMRARTMPGIHSATGRPSYTVLEPTNGPAAAPIVVTSCSVALVTSSASVRGAGLGTGLASATAGGLRARTAAAAELPPNRATHAARGSSWTAPGSVAGRACGSARLGRRVFMRAS